MAMGRPRAFDREKALESAVKVFWSKGYEGASLADLTEAMGINPPSLYAAFGNKEGLFREVLERYATGPGAHVLEALEAPTARATAQVFLNGAVEALCVAGVPKGCLIVREAMAGGDSACDTRDLVNAKRLEGQKKLRQRFERAQNEGDLSKDVDAGDLARFITTIGEGLSVERSGGATRKQLHAIVERAMKAWPE